LSVASSSPAHDFLAIAGGVLTAVGLIFLMVGLLIRGGTRRFGGRAARAQGTIVGFDTTDPGTRRLGNTRIRYNAYPGMGAQIIYRPTVSFTTPDGRAVTATSRVGSNPRAGKVGDAVTVLYDAGNPEHVRVDSRTGTCLETAFVLFGGAVAALGIILLIASR
jgi:hypothetical protein